LKDYEVKKYFYNSYPDRKAAHILKFCTIKKLICAGNERSFGHRTKGFFAFLSRAMGLSLDGNLRDNAAD
jgi:hypothetical protein